MQVKAPSYEQEGGGEAGDFKRRAVRTIIEETHKLCNEFAGELIELNVPLQLGTELYMRIEHSEHPRYKVKTAYLSKQYNSHGKNMFTMYVAKEQCLNGFSTFLLIRYEGFSLQGPSSEVTVDNLYEFQYPIDWLKEAHDILINTEGIE